ncbi:MAG TPA: hypothetical protein VF540_08170, partial [Segetibacter sp.]
NNVLRLDMIEYQHNPFPKYQLKLEKTSRQFLDEDELKAIEDGQTVPVKEWTYIRRCSYLHHTPVWEYQMYGN